MAFIIILVTPFSSFAWFTDDFDVLNVDGISTTINRFQVPEVGMQFVWVEKGCFMMGSDSGDKDERPRHKVCLDGFWMGIHEVTHGEWEKVMGSKLPSAGDGLNFPVGGISWDQTQAFIKKLSEMVGFEFRLPTEAEWEYACRAGSKGNFCFGDDFSELEAYAWYKENSETGAQMSAQKKANKFGLFDMHGNMMEWCQDYKGPYQSAGTSHRARGPLNGKERILRGGYWGFGPGKLRCANRDSGFPDKGYAEYGFRLVYIR